MSNNQDYVFSEQLDKQLVVISIYHKIRNTVLGSTLKKTLSTVDPAVLREEIGKYVPPAGCLLMQSTGLREETVFALPCVLKVNPKLLGYYRMLLGMSQKAFYGMICFKKYSVMEEIGSIPQKWMGDMPNLCQSLNTQLLILLQKAKASNQDIMAETDLHDLPLLSLGMYADGCWRNIKGQSSQKKVFESIITIVVAYDVNIENYNKTKSIFTFKNKLGETWRIRVSSDPDVAIEKLSEDYKNAVSKELCIEVKGGDDISNVHNRAGEAEKSHQKAKKEGWKVAWTLIRMEGLSADQKAKILRETSSTDEWFDVTEVMESTGSGYDNFRTRLKALLNLP